MALLPKEITDHMFNWPCRRCHSPRFYWLIGSDVGTISECSECGHENELDADIVAQVDLAFIAAVRKIAPESEVLSDEELKALRRTER